jgi:uncharacterized protein YegL
MVRRLPVYLAIDTSESMAGPAFEAVRRGIDSLIQQLRGDPMAIETVWISVITFGRHARVATPLTDIVQFQPPHLVLGSGTALGAGLDLLEKQMKAEVVPHTPEHKGDWKPIVFLLTDGDPTDGWEKIADRFRNEICGKKANIIAVACGDEVNLDNLRRITSAVLNLRDGSEASFREFFKWVSASVQTTSVKFSSGRPEGVELPSLPAEVKAASGRGASVVDPWVFLLAKCVRKKGLYLVRFRKEAESNRSRPTYKATAAHALDGFDSDGGGVGLTVSSDQLHGMMPCPHCGNAKMAVCGFCDAKMCISGAGQYTCPWCNQTADYNFTGGFDVSGGAG